MRQKKEQPSNAQLRDLISKHDIRLEGSAPPREWPDPQRNHFQAIRNISFLRYEEYKADASIDRQKKELYRERVKRLRGRASNLLKDLNINENTWRHSTEYIVNKPFKKNPVCHKCGGEKWNCDKQANPLDNERCKLLDEKRKLRKKCCCATESVASNSIDNDETEEIFNFCTEKTVSHCPGDVFGNISIPMAPDRVIGLRCTSGLDRYTSITPSDLTHCPIEGMEILYPFLVVEAKREDGAPGFRAIQAQTAFPLRRLLTIQESLSQTSGVETEPFLVWFFAYQGEEWRLYAGTRKKRSTVQIFDLWHGTIESRDGALQLLLIVDYIWSWARDIYRPAIITCLQALAQGSREFSQASTIRRRYSSSIPGSVCPSNSFDDPNAMVLEQNLISMDDDCQILSQPPEQIMNDVEYETPVQLQGLEYHPFLRWRKGHELLPDWNGTACIRHSDIIDISLRILMFPVFENSYGKLIDSPYWSIYTESIPINNQILKEIAMAWAETDIHSSISESSRATIFFQTNCGDAWKIKRTLYCIVWVPLGFSLETLSEFDAHSARDFIKRKIEDMQQIRGQKSVQNAMCNTSFMLSMVGSDDPGWIPWDREKMLFHSAEDLYMNTENAPEFQALGPTSLPVTQKCVFIRSRKDGAPDLPLHPRIREEGTTQEAIIAVRQPSWPEDYPEFCMFVLSESDFDKDKLYKLLRDALIKGNYFGNKRELSKKDGSDLRHWCKAIKEMI